MVALLRDPPMNIPKWPLFTVYVIIREYLCPAKCRYGYYNYASYGGMPDANIPPSSAVIQVLCYEPSTLFKAPYVTI